MRRHTQVSQNAVHFAGFVEFQVARQVPEVGGNKGKTRIAFQVAGIGRCVGVLIEGKEFPRRQFVQNGSCVATAAEGHVHVGAFGTDVQAVQAFGQHHGSVVSSRGDGFGFHW